MKRMSWKYVFGIVLAAFLLAGCSSSDSVAPQPEPEPAPEPQPETGEATVFGQVVNGPLTGAEVAISDEFGEFLFSVTADAEGLFSVVVDQAGPYRLRARGGLLDGQPYEGELEAICQADARCILSPLTTAFVALADRGQLDFEDARASLRNRLRLHIDPFAERDDVDPAVFDVAAASDSIDRGRSLAPWIASLLSWFDGEGSSPEGVPEAPPSTGPGIEPDTTCSDFTVDVAEPHYLVANHAQMVAALEDPEGLANGRLVIGITGDIDDGPQGTRFEPELWWLADFRDNPNDLVLIGWTQDGSRPVIDLSGSAQAFCLRIRLNEVTISGIEFRNSTAYGRRGDCLTGRGGAVSVAQRVGGVGRLFLHDTVFRDNTTQASLDTGSSPFTLGEGGAVFSPGFITIARSEFHGNYARTAGGAVFSRSGVNVCHSRFEGNRMSEPSGVQSGGAIRVRNQDAIGDIRIHDSVFVGNETRSVKGGAIYLDSGGVFPATRVGEVIVTESEFVGNVATQGAAVIYSEGVVTSSLASDPTPGSADVYIVGSRFENNVSEGSGPILQANEAEIFIFDSVFEENTVEPPQALIVANGGTVAGSSFNDNSNPAFAGDFVDQGGNVFLGSSSNPFGPPAGTIVFNDSGRLYTVAPDGSDRELLLDVGWFQPSPAWSPDGRELVYVGGTFPTDLFRFSLQDRQVHRLTRRSDVQALEPAWSVNNEIAYVRRNESFGTNPFLIYVTGPEGGEGEHLTGGPSASDMERFPAWSPDGENLIFSVRENWSFNPTTATLRLYEIGRDGVGRGPISGFRDADQPAWSPDGNWLAYVEGRRVKVRALDNGDVIDFGEGDSPTWSPDGTMIAFHHDGSIFRASLLEPEERALVTEGNQPNWSRR